MFKNKITPKSFHCLNHPIKHKITKLLEIILSPTWIKSPSQSISLFSMCKSCNRTSHFASPASTQTKAYFGKAFGATFDKRHLYIPPRSRNFQTPLSALMFR